MLCYVAWIRDWAGIRRKVWRKMKKKWIKEVAVLLVFALSVRVESAYAGWQRQGSVWKYETDGVWIKDSWVKADEGWYYLGKDGSMESGWKQDQGRWYFLNPVADGDYGKMLTGWQWIDGRCYFLSEREQDGHPLGAMYAKEKTPDGYQVNKSGAWVDEKGEIVEILGKGISSTGKTSVSDTREAVASGRGGGGGSRSSGGSGRSGRGGSGSGGGSGRGGSGSKSGGSSGRGGSDSKSGSESGGGSSENDGENDERGGGSDGDKKENSGSGNRGDQGNSGHRDDQNSQATPSNAQMVNWYVHFADESNHQNLLEESRQGTIREGESLTLNFRKRVIDSKKRIWESIEEPPFSWEVYGPGDQIYYVEYRQTGQLSESEDPDHKEKERLKSWLEAAKIQESILTGEDIFKIPDERIVVSDGKGLEGRLLSIAGQIPAGEEYAVYVIGRNVEPEGTVLKKTLGEEAVYSKLVEDQFFFGKDQYMVVRFSIKNEGKQENRVPEEGKATWEKLHWDYDDVLDAKIAGGSYCFRCVDQNYSDRAGNHRQGALFLCDSVIPADFGSHYSYEQLEDGSYEYVFYPGPVMNFGEGNDYKYSDIRAWLQESEENFEQAKTIDIGISKAYTGSTGAGMYDQLKESDLKGSSIGNQKLTGKLFILSVEEALKYRKWLWQVEGSGPFSKGYWLQNPVGTAQDYDTGFVYAVDLVNGQIRPAGIHPEDGEGYAIGVRPAFVMPQE